MWWNFHFCFLLGTDLSNARSMYGPAFGKPGKHSAETESLHPLCLSTRCTCILNGLSLPQPLPLPLGQATCSILRSLRLDLLRVTLLFAIRLQPIAFLMLGIWLRSRFLRIAVPQTETTSSCPRACSPCMSPALHVHRMMVRLPPSTIPETLYD